MVTAVLVTAVLVTAVLVTAVLVTSVLVTSVLVTSLMVIELVGVSALWSAGVTATTTPLTVFTNGSPACASRGAAEEITAPSASSVASRNASRRGPFSSVATSCPIAAWSDVPAVACRLARAGVTTQHSASVLSV